MADYQPVARPLARLEAVYGLTDEGVPTLATRWTNHFGGDDEDVDHLTKAGMLGMVQEEVLAEALGLVPEDDDEEDGDGQGP